MKTKSNRLKIITTLLLFLLIGYYSCSDEVLNPALAKAEKAGPIGNVKSWYAAHYPEDIPFLSSNGRGSEVLKAEWSHAFTTKEDPWRVVETDFMSRERSLFFDKDCMEKYNETNDPKYRQCYSRLVFRINLNTNDTVAFLMTVVPNLDWLEISNFKPFMEVTYLYRSKNFGGRILFHNLDGSFSNGWVYKEGKIVGRVESYPNFFKPLPNEFTDTSQ